MPVVFNTEGLKILLERGFNSSSTRSHVSKLWVGANQVTPAIAATDLTLPLPTQYSTVETIDSGTSTTGWTGSGDTATVYSNTDWYKSGTSGLGFGKTGTSTTNFGIWKATTSKDFTAKRLYTWLYLTGTGLAALATGTGVRVKFGSAATDYYYKDFATSDLASGWNLLSFTGSGATGSTGTPSISACDYSKLEMYSSGTGATGTGDFVSSYWHLASSDDFPQSLSVGYPTAPSTDAAITLRALLNDVQANGYQITGAAFKNTDDSPVMAILGSFAEEGKNSSEQLIIFSKVKLKQFSSTE